MIRLTFCIHRRSDVSSEDFHRYWLDEHGPLVLSFAETLDMRRYVQGHTVSRRLGELLRSQRGTSEPFDGLADVWFDDITALLAAAGTSEGQEALEALLIDERRFIDLERSSVFLVHEHQIVPAVHT